MDYALAVENGRRLLEAASAAELEADEAWWRLSELTWEITESGIEGRTWAKDLGCSSSRVSTLRTVYRLFGERRHRVRFQDAYHAALTPKHAEELIAEAGRLGLSVSGLRQRRLKGTTEVPSEREQDRVLRNVVASRSAILRALGAIQAGTTAEDPEIVLGVAREVQEAVRELVRALRPLKVAQTPVP